MIHDKTEYAIHMRNLKQALNHRLLLKNMHRIIKFNQKAWLTSYIGINIYPRKKAKIDFENVFFKLMNNAVFGKTMQNVRKHKGTKVVTNYQTTNFFYKSLLAIEMRKTNICMNKPVYLGLSISELSKIAMYQFWCN